MGIVRAVCAALAAPVVALSLCAPVGAEPAAFDLQAHRGGRGETTEIAVWPEGAEAMTAEEVETKFSGLAAKCLPPHQIEELMATIDALESHHAHHLASLLKPL